jgi:hypothetical protein
MDSWVRGVHGFVALVGAGVLLVSSGTQREKPLVRSSQDSLPAIEARAWTRPGDPEAIRHLAEAYLGVRQPGLAIVLIEAAPQEVRADVSVRHVYARALMDEGRDGDSLRIERSVVGECQRRREGDDVGPTQSGCDPVLVASAVRRVGILEELVALGVEDAQAQPEVSLVAYKNATREARIVAE